MERKLETRNTVTEASSSQPVASEFFVKSGKLGNLSQVSGTRVIRYQIGDDYHQIVMAKCGEKVTKDLSQPLSSDYEVACRLPGNQTPVLDTVSIQRSENTNIVEDTSTHVTEISTSTPDSSNTSVSYISLASASHSNVITTSSRKERFEDSESPIVIIENVSKIIPVSSGKHDISNATNTTSTINLPIVEKGSSQTLASMDEYHNRGTYKCEECDYSSSNKHYLKQHVDLVHNADRPYKCPFCDYAGKRSHSLREHLIVHSNERPFECSHCNATFRKKGHLTNHTKLHQKSVHCPLCQKSVVQADLESHSKTVHNVENVFVCELCNFIAPDEQKIIEHMKEHRSQQIFVCSSCNYMARDYGAFVAHAETHQTENRKQPDKIVTKSPQHPVQENKELLVKCSECGFVATSAEVMKTHMWKHIKSEDMTQIEKNVSTPSKTSQSTVSEKSVYKCVDCDFVCEEAYSFVVHMLSHRPELQYIQPQVLKDQKKGSQNAASLIIPKSMTDLPEGNDKVPPVSNIVTTSPDTPIVAPAVRSETGSASQVESPAKTLMVTTTISSSKQPSHSKGPIFRRDLKANILSKRPGSLKSIASTKKEIPAFVHDKANGRFLCTICGYTCEYQRTIKAHIWKHSGNKDIEYPMFQNGPLSIYDESPIARENTATETAPNTNVEALPIAKEETEPSVKPAKQTGNAVSSVASALAHLLAARAMTGLTVKPSNVGLVQDNSQEKVKDVDQTKVADTFQVNNNCQIGVKERIQAKVIHNIQAKVMEKMQICSVLTEENNEDIETREVADSPMETFFSTKENVEATELNVTTEESSERMVCDEGVVVNDVSGTKRKLDELNDNEEAEDTGISQAVKVFCSAEEKQKEGNVVVETVDTLQSLNGYTGMKSQQNSPRSSNIAGSTTDMDNDAVIADTEPECSDSGIASEGASTAAPLVSHPRKSARLQKKGCMLDSSGLKSESAGGDTGEKVVSFDTKENDDMVPKKSIPESAVTLLSLLKKGPNYNPACPVSLEQEREQTQVKDEKKEEKQISRGISSSLLAVIEQLRERSRSEVDLDETGNKKIIGKKKVKKESLEDVAAMENLDNVERIEEEDEEFRFRCKLCHYSNSSTFVMKQHMKLHKTKRPFECSLCVFMAESSEDLQNHMIKHCKVRTYQCKLCPSAFNYKSQLRAHMRAHNEKDVFACDECEFESNNPSVLRNHVTECHEMKQYVCEICEQRFLSKQDLRAHKRLTCLRHKSQGTDDQDLADIMTKDEGDQSSVTPKFRKCELKCSKCDYVTNSIVRFGNHEKTHDEPKTLKCDFCDFPALSNRSLKSHMKRHVNDQRFVQQPLEQYKCNLCGYVCHHLPSLKSHMWRHASDENYSYEFTNEVINAAIDYDSRLDSKECCKSDVEEFNRTIREKMKQRLESQGKGDAENAQYAVCWVTFRCCQCGYEVINKAQLNLHMKAHSDVIRWTLQVSQQNSSGSSQTTGGVASQGGRVLQRPEIDVRD